MTNCSDSLRKLQESNKVFMQDYKGELAKHVEGQSPKICVLTCSDSRVVPEFIFNKDIGEVFVVRVAGNIAKDESVITSLEYAVDHLHVDVLLILGHTNCGAVKATEESTDDSVELFEEIKKGFSCDKNHIVGNVKYQLDKLHSRSKVIAEAVNSGKLCLKGAIYNLETGEVNYL